MSKIEIWKDVKGYESLYQVSNLGRIRSIKNGIKIKKQYERPNGYMQVCLCQNGKITTYKTHRLVAEAFIPNINNLPEVNHKDENKINNCVDNLEWCTSSYNKNYGTRNTKCMHTKRCSCKMY